MMRIWGRMDSPNIQKVIWCANELGLLYERIDAGHEHGVVTEPWYLAMNPNGLVPTIEEDGFVLWESNAIVKYLCAKYAKGSLSPENPHAFADADRWISWQGSTLGPVMRQIVFEIVRTPADRRNPARVTELTAAAAKCWTILDHRLEGRTFLMGQMFTMADLVFGPHLRLWLDYPVARPTLPRLGSWYERVSSREPFQRSLPPVVH